MKKNTFIPEAMRGVCFECGARGHFGRDCPVRKANDGRRGKKRVRFNPEEDVAEAAEVDEGLEPRTAMDGDVDDDDDEAEELQASPDRKSLVKQKKAKARHVSPSAMVSAAVSFGYCRILDNVVLVDK